MSSDSKPIEVEVTSAAALRSWLTANHARQDSVWLVTYKKHTGDRYVSTEEMLGVLLCFGWVDGRRRKLDDDRTMQLISPRRAQHWAKSYKKRASRLIDEGSMQPAGHRAIAESKRNGLWDFMDDVDALIVPADLQAALADKQDAVDRFAALPKSYRRNVLRWVKLAKTAPTRQKRVDTIAALAAENRRVPNM